MSDTARDLILVVDDVDINRDLLESILTDTYAVVQAASGTEAIDMMFSGSVKPTLVLLDVQMPDIDGLTVLQMMKDFPLTERVPVIFITATEEAETRGLELGAVDFVTKPFNRQVVMLRIANQLTIRKYQTQLEELVSAKVAELLHSKDRMLENMANIIEYRDLESGQHVKRTIGMTRILVDHLRANPQFERNISYADRDIIIKSVPLHDIGKIAIPDVVLLKPARLTPEEFEIIKTHAAIGSTIIDSIMGDEDPMFYQHCRDICRHHHERWDGKGYPDGLAGEDIPLSARILAVVDVYDALVSPRVYKDPLSHEKAVHIITDGSGTQFDPKIIQAFLEVQEDFKNFDRDHV
ncbi:MAG: response regulator [Oscillospiraceae bacterium]|nr:response regulator [Oscillospiraceae bacterium]